MIKAKDDFIIQKMMDGYMVVPIGKSADTFHALLQMNETGAFYWRLIEKGMTPEEMVRAAMDRFEGLDEATASQDIREYLESISPAVEMIEE